MKHTIVNFYICLSSYQGIFTKAILVKNRNYTVKIINNKFLYVPIGLLSKNYYFLKYFKYKYDF